MINEVLFLVAEIDSDYITQKQTAISASGMAVAVSAAPADMGYVVCGTGTNTSIGDIPIGDLGESDLSLGNNTITCRNMRVATSLSGDPTCITQLDGPVTLASSMDISGDLNGMPYPPPYCHIRSINNGITSDALYVAFTDATVTTVSSNATQFEWDNTNKRVYVSSTGVYEVIFIGNAFTDTTNDEVYTRVNIDGTQQTYTRQRINTNTDPHILTIAWVGSVTAGEYITITIDGTQNTTLYPGTTLTIKRLS